jgi:predicted RNA binding protein YcfA (HicA-like mRNA interferase family)
MPVLPSLRPQDIISVLLRAGFKILRTKGSHFRFEHPLSKKKVTVSFHPGDVPWKTVFSILRQAGLTIAEFLRYLGRK